MMFMVDTIISGLISKIIKDCVDISIAKIREADKNRTDVNQSFETRIYQVIIDALNEITHEQFKNQDVLFDTAEIILNGFKNSRNDYVKSGLRKLNLYSDEKFEEFIKLVCYGMGKEDNLDLYKEILLMTLDQKSEYSFEELRTINEKLDQVDDLIKNQNIREKDKENISIFISYSWNDEGFVDKLDKELQIYGYKVKRDIRDAEYAQSLKNFMKKIRETDYSTIVLSDGFLKSENCMREILEFIKDEDYKDRIIPVMLESAKDIWGSNKGISYTLYWKDREEKFKEELRQLDEESKCGYIEDLKHISSIKDSIGEIIKIFRDMKMFNGSNNLAEDIDSYITRNYDFNKLYK